MTQECPNNPGHFCGEHDEIKRESISNKTTVKVAAFFIGGIISASFFLTLMVKSDLAEAQSSHISLVDKKFERQDREIMTLAKTVLSDHQVVMDLVTEMRITNDHLWDLKNNGVRDAM